MLKTSITRKKLDTLLIMVIFGGILPLIGCKNDPKPLPSIPSLEYKILTRLEARVKKLEDELNDVKNKSSIDKLTRIKSITMRFGTTDDRLRIYWSNGRKTDMPCTKEQSQWVCG